MQFRLSAILALSIGISAAFADDDFDLPDDVQKAEVPASVEDVADIPVNFAPIEATTTVTTDSSKKENPAAFKEHQIPEELNRPLRVGIFTGVKELYFKYQGETVHVTVSKNKVKFEA
jgi:stage II sporulation protein D